MSDTINRETQIPKAVVEAIYKRWPNAWHDMLKQLQYDSLNGCYWLDWAGMYVGIEDDGYIHT